MKNPTLVMQNAILPAMLLSCVAQGALVTYLPLDSATGLTAGAPDSGTNDASISSGGKFASAASFDGAGDYFEVDAGGGVAGTGARTVSLWANQSAGTGGLRSPVTFGSNGNGSKFDVDIDNGNNGIEVGVGNGRSTTSGIGFTSGDWQMVTVSLGDSQKIGQVLAYLNGGTAVTGGTNTRAVNTSGTRMLIGTAANVAAGSGNPSIQFWNGLVDDISVWDEALSQSEITSLYDVGNTIDLSYTGNLFDQLKQVHDAGSGSTNIDSLQWTYATGLGAAAGISGSGTNFALVLDAANGTGLTSSPIPEPALALLGSLGLLGILRRRRV